MPRVLNAILTLAAITYTVNCGVLTPHAYGGDHVFKTKANSKYSPLGEEVVIGNITVYETNSRNSSRVLIAAYDAFGFSNNNVFEVADKMAEKQGGFRVIMPDFFRGEFYDADPDVFPPDFDDLIEWIGRVADWDRIIKWDLLNLVQVYKAQGVEHIGIYGQCWGGLVALLSVLDPDLIGQFEAAGLIHPSLVQDEYAPGINAPMYLMPTSEDPDMTQFYQVLKQKFGNNTGHRRFTDMLHGFASARGDFSDPITMSRIEEMVSLLGLFFHRIFSQ